MKPSLLTVIAAPLILYKPATNIAFKPFTAFKLYLWLCKCNWFWSRITFDAAAASLLKGAKLWLNCSLTEIVIKQLKPWSAEASKITKVFEVKKKKMRSLAPVAGLTFFAKFNIALFAKLRVLTVCFSFRGILLLSSLSSVQNHHAFQQLLWEELSYKLLLLLQI